MLLLPPRHRAPWRRHRSLHPVVSVSGRSGPQLRFGARLLQQRKGRHTRERGTLGALGCAQPRAWWNHRGRVRPGSLPSRPWRQHASGAVGIRTGVCSRWPHLGPWKATGRVDGCLANCSAAPRGICHTCRRPRRYAHREEETMNQRTTRRSIVRLGTAGGGGLGIAPECCICFRCAAACRDRPARVPHPC